MIKSRDVVFHENENLVDLEKTEKTNVRLNLFNHVLVLFSAKFACNFAIRYPVFRWELCKGSV